MKALMHGNISRPVVAIIGVWDPLLPDHRLLFEEMRSHSCRSSLDSLIVALNPDPVTYLAGPARVPIYNDANTRVQLIKSCGLDGVLQIRFAQRDIDGDAADLFAILHRHVHIKELWLGARQSFGRGPGGSANAITKLAEEYGINIVRTPPVRLATSTVRELLIAGRLSEATRLVGRPPTLCRPKSGKLRLAWRPGIYRALPIATPDLSLEQKEDCVEIELTGGASNLTTLSWPSQSLDYLAFVSGPGDSDRASTVQ